jgi:hypothetical protein
MFQTVPQQAVMLIDSKLLCPTVGEQSAFQQFSGDNSNNKTYITGSSIHDPPWEIQIFMLCLALGGPYLASKPGFCITKTLPKTIAFTHRISARVTNRNLELYRSLCFL